MMNWRRGKYAARFWRCTGREYRGNNLLQLRLTTTPAAARQDEKHIKWLKDNNLLNTYAEKVIEFPAIFPDEPELGKTLLTWTVL